jgi:hypothetical protein
MKVLGGEIRDLKVRTGKYGGLRGVWLEFGDNSAKGGSYSPSRFLQSQNCALRLGREGWRRRGLEEVVYHFQFTYKHSMISMVASPSK